MLNARAHACAHVRGLSMLECARAIMRFSIVLHGCNLASVQSTCHCLCTSIGSGLIDPQGTSEHQQAKKASRSQKPQGLKVSRSQRPGPSRHAWRTSRPGGHKSLGVLKVPRSRRPWPFRHVWALPGHKGCALVGLPIYLTLLPVGSVLH